MSTLKFFVKKIFFRLLYLIKGESVYLNKWKNRSKHDVEKYIDNIEESHRAWLIGFFKDEDSFLEVGCGWGPNLQLLKSNNKSNIIQGIDISPSSAEVGIAKGIPIACGDALKVLKGFNDSTFDIVFTDMMLLYVGPKKIEEYIHEMVRVAKKSVYLLEFHDSHYLSKHTEDGWVYDYSKMVGAMIIPIPSKFQKKGRWSKYAKLIKIGK